MNSLSGLRPDMGQVNPTRRPPSGRPPSSKYNQSPKGYNEFSVNQYTPEAQDVYQQLHGDITNPDNYLRRLTQGDEEAFNEIEAPAFRQFNALQGGLASRFSGQGMGSRRSSGFQNESSAAASNFAQDLASRRGDLMRNAYRDLSEMSNMFLQNKPYETGLVEKPQHQMSTASQYGLAGINAAGQIAGGAAKGFFGG